MLIDYLHLVVLEILRIKRKFRKNCKECKEEFYMDDFDDEFVTDKSYS
jgi:hypothetical protein